MGFSDKQLRALGRNVPARNIRTRLSDGRELSYIEGWYAIAEANRIFGFDGWDRETCEAKCVLARESRGHHVAVYSARMRITVRNADGVVARVGHGTGEAFGGTAGEVHDRALKAAETDATKRALATFGKAFGLALYAGGRAQRKARVATPEAAATATPKAVPADGGAAVASGTIAEVKGGSSLPDGSQRTAHDTPAKRHSGIDKSALTFSEPTRLRDKEHLRYVASQPCLLCSAKPSDAHHVRFAQPRALGRKVSDEFTVPLCRAHHRELHHSGNEAAWWHDMGIDPIEVAKELWDESRRGQGEAQAQSDRPAEARSGDA